MSLRERAAFAKSGSDAAEWENAGEHVSFTFRNENFPIFLIAVYAKNEKANLTKAERNELAKQSEVFPL